MTKTWGDATGAGLDSMDYSMLSDAFKKVQNPNDWRGAIDWQGVVGEYERLIISDAIIYFTSTRPGWTRVGQTSVWRVRATGYRMGPAGP